jgi:hypothetical protein
MIGITGEWRFRSKHDKLGVLDLHLKFDFNIMKLESQCDTFVDASRDDAGIHFDYKMPQFMANSRICRR